MIDWSRFAGSLWDGILAASVPPETRSDKVATFDAAVTDYLHNTLRTSNKELQPPQLQAYIYMSFYNLRLLAWREPAVALNINRGTAHDCSQYAVETITRVQAHEAAINYQLPCMLQYQTVSSLANSLLILCSIAVSDLGKLDLLLDTWLPTVRQAFDTAVALLNDLAEGVPLARRVLDDFERIIPVVQGVHARWIAEGQLGRGPLDWNIMKDVIPPNVATLLPYREQVPDMGSPALHNDMVEAETGLSPWNQHAGRSDPRSGVLWI